MLEEIGFIPQLVKLIMFSVSLATLSLIWNCKKLYPFSPKRGLYPGDPLAPYLFVLCMEALNHRITQTAAEGTWKGIKASQNGPCLTHIFFADDLILFGEASSQQAKVMAYTLIAFFSDISKKNE